MTDHRSARVAEWLYRHRIAIFAAWWIHVFVIHYIFLGYISWDGFTYRVAPVIELLQHGDLGSDKYPYAWTLNGYVPFVELVHLPFLRLLGLRGLLFSFPWVVFPMCVAAVFLMVRELTADKLAGLFGAIAYAAIPVMNEQPYSGYIDFAVVGALAYWVFAIVRLHTAIDRTPVATSLRVAIATALLSLSRQQGLYIAIVLFAVLGYAMFCERERFRIRIRNGRALARGGIAALIGASPAIALQIYKYKTYGSPIAPSELRLFGIQIFPGVSLRDFLVDSGLGGDDLASMAVGFFENYVLHLGWPIGAFFSSRFMGMGLVFILALCILGPALRNASRLERALLLGCVMVSILSRDFALPRYAYTLVLATILVVARGISVAIASRRWWVWVAFGVLALHALRPELDFFQYKSNVNTSWRMNVGDSPYFLRRHELLPYPDRGYRLVLIDRTGFFVQLYGRELTNEVLETVLGNEIDPGCRRLARYVDADPSIVFVDEQGFTKTCKRECVVQEPRRCAAWRIEPAR